MCGVLRATSLSPNLFYKMRFSYRPVYIVLGIDLPIQIKHGLIREEKIIKKIWVPSQLFFEPSAHDFPNSFVIIAKDLGYLNMIWLHAGYVLLKNIHQGTAFYAKLLTTFPCTQSWVVGDIVEDLGNFGRCTGRFPSTVTLCWVLFVLGFSVSN